MNKVLSNLISLDNIKQWEERDSIIKESVSQHSFKVAAICSLLLSKIDCPDSYKLLCHQYALLHDFDESIIGRDIPHTTKYNNFNGTDIKHVLNSFVDRNLENLGLATIFKKFDDSVKSFVKLCDWIALYTFVVRHERLGCNVFEEEKQYCVKNIDEKIMDVTSLFKNKFNIDFDDKIVLDLIY